MNFPHVSPSFHAPRCPPVAASVLVSTLPTVGSFPLAWCELCHNSRANGGLEGGHGDQGVGYTEFAAGQRAGDET